MILAASIAHVPALLVLGFCIVLTALSRGAVEGFGEFLLLLLCEHFSATIYCDLRY